MISIYETSLCNGCPLSVPKPTDKEIVLQAYHDILGLNPIKEISIKVHTYVHHWLTENGKGYHA